MANGLAGLAQRATQPPSPQIDFNAPPQPTLPANPADPRYSMLSRLASAANQAFVQPAYDKFNVFGDVASGKASMADPETQARVMGAAELATGFGAPGAPEGALGAGFQFRFPKGIIAYHGSPHPGFDVFDPKYIGTGEGAQAYSHGQYFAGNEDVAKSYRDALTRTNEAEGIVNYYLDRNKDNRELAIKHMESVVRDLSSYNPGWGREQEYRDAIALLKNPNWKRPGSMYQVRLHADPEDLLHWHKPLEEQSPAVTEILQRQFPHTYERAQEHAESYGINPTGQNIYHDLTQDYLPEEASQLLNEAGIPGMEYWDAGSRGARQARSSNYVVYNPQIIDILKRYGLTGPGLAALAYMANQQRNAAPPSQ